MSNPKSTCLPDCSLAVPITIRRMRPGCTLQWRTSSPHNRIAKALPIPRCVHLELGFAPEADYDSKLIIHRMCSRFRRYDFVD